MASRCSYRDGGRRCSRNGFGTPALCRPHAIQANLEGKEFKLPKDSPFFGWLELADRTLSRSNNETVQQIRNAFGEFLAGTANAQQIPQADYVPPKQASQPQNKKNVLSEARATLGFEDKEQITKELVKARKKNLATVFHPDRPGGSLSAMKRVNQAADLLICSL